MTSSEPTFTYREIYSDTASLILALSGLPRSILIDASTELQADYELFCVDYRGAYLGDAYIEFSATLQHWDIRWPKIADSGLNGLTLPQFYCARAWNRTKSRRTVSVEEPLPKDGIETTRLATALWQP